MLGLVFEGDFLPCHKLTQDDFVRKNSLYKPFTLKQAEILGM